MTLTAGALTQVSVAPSSDVVQSAVATGGSTPYAYQWYKAVSGTSFTPGTANIVSGATALTLADTGLAPSTTYFYKVVITDALSATATSTALSVTTAANTFSALPVSTIFNVSVATVQQGLGQYNTSNLAIFSREAVASSFGNLGYKIYFSPTQVGIDFGSSSNTFAMANAIFSQQPNILNNQGYLVVIPFLSAAQTAVQSLTFPATPASGTFELTYLGTETTSALQFNTSAAAIQTALQALAGLSTVTVSGTVAAGFVITFTGVSGAVTNLTISANSLMTAGSVAVTPVVATTTIGSTAETLDAAILRTQGLVQYFGIMAAEITPQTVMLAAAAEVQALNKLILFTSYNQGDVAPGGMLDLLRSGTFTQSRAVPYFENNTALQPTSSLVFMAAYAGLGFSVNFNGSLTTITMQLKTLAGVQPDPSMNPTLYTLCQAAGADVYASVQGIAKVLTSGANDFFDNQYNLQWFVGALQVAAFNYLATVSTKVPQTESGMDGLKGAVRTVCQQAVANGFLAPGSWNSATTFGNQQNLLNNILQVGYYIYSTPISQQLQAVRVTRTAPVIQIAAKYAGAIQSGSIIVYVNP